MKLLAARIRPTFKRMVYPKNGGLVTYAHQMVFFDTMLLLNTKAFRYPLFVEGFKLGGA